MQGIHKRIWKTDGSKQRGGKQKEHDKLSHRTFQFTRLPSELEKRKR